VEQVKDTADIHGQHSRIGKSNVKRSLTFRQR
jgi:hypothetical protein